MKSIWDWKRIKHVWLDKLKARSLLVWIDVINSHFLSVSQIRFVPFPSQSECRIFLLFSKRPQLSWHAVQQMRKSCGFCDFRQKLDKLNFFPEVRPVPSESQAGEAYSLDYDTYLKVQPVLAAMLPHEICELNCLRSHLNLFQQQQRRFVAVLLELLAFQIFYH